MPSSWILTRQTKNGGRRYRVLYRLGGRETPQAYGGTFTRKEDALTRKRWIDGELAALRVPDVKAPLDMSVQVRGADGLRDRGEVDGQPP